MIWMVLLAAALYPMVDQYRSQPPAAAPPGVKQDAEPVSVVGVLKREAGLLAPLVTSELARGFLGAVDVLPEPQARTVYSDRDKGVAVNALEWAKLPADQQAGLKARECAPEFYYMTGYGSPLVYVRVVDLLASHGVSAFKGTRVLDFGYGTIGHLRLMNERGAEAHGVDVEPLLAALYSEAGDTSETLKVHTGRWPSEPGLVKAIGSGFDVITSKNTLKAGYIHPSPPPGKTVDEKQLVKLGVDDTAYLKAVHDALKPGGLIIIYNIGPAQSHADDPEKPYIPWADCKSPFSRAQFEAAGFEVLVFDADDQAWVLECWRAMGYDEGKSREESAKAIFAWYTVARRKP